MRMPKGRYVVNSEKLKVYLSEYSDLVNVSSLSSMEIPLSVFNKLSIELKTNNAFKKNFTEPNYTFRLDSAEQYSHIAPNVLGVIDEVIVGHGFIEDEVLLQTKAGQTSLLPLTVIYLLAEEFVKRQQEEYLDELLGLLDKAKTNNSMYSYYNTERFITEDLDSLTIAEELRELTPGGCIYRITHKDESLILPINEGRGIKKVKEYYLYVLGNYTYTPKINLKPVELDLALKTLIKFVKPQDLILELQLEVEEKQTTELKRVNIFNTNNVE